MGLLATDLVPFPALPETLKNQFSLSDLWLRPFGQEAEDREVNFNQPSRTYLEVQILECCTGDHQGKKPDSSFFWNLEVGKRIECLLAIATSRDRQEFFIPLRCLNSACGEGIEIDFSMEELSKLQISQNEDKLPQIKIGEQIIRLRKPTGWDQLNWLAQSFPNERAAAEVMLKTLIIPEKKGELEPTRINLEQGIAIFNQVMEEVDPLVNFQAQVQCPCCGTQDFHQIDFGAFALKRLQNSQQQLLDMVHCLASFYHWNESEIFAIPPWRRQSYLARIEREQR